MTKIKSEKFRSLEVKRMFHGREMDSIIIYQICNTTTTKQMRIVIGIDGLTDLINELIRLAGEK